MTWFINWIKSLFAKKEALPVQEKPAPVEEPVEIKPEPVLIKSHAENPAYKEAKKYNGKTEFMASFVAFMVRFWPKAGLPHYKAIAGTTFAWCGLFVLAMNSEVGQKWVAGAAGAKNWAKYGVAIEWKVNGIPRGAVMHLDHDGDCVGGSNHVTFADGDCTAEDLTKLKQVPGFGGNQGNTVKRSMYPIYEICAVRWPSEIPKPGKIEKSVDCAGKGSSGESTR